MSDYINTEILSTKLSFFDMDNTLVKGNALLGFVFFILRDSKYPTVSNWLFKINFYIKVKLLKKSKRPILLKFLKGYKKRYLKNMARNFVKSDLIFNNKILRYLEDDKANGFMPVVISANINEIVCEVANHLKIDTFLASSLSYSAKEYCQGCLEKDISGNKQCELLSLERKNENFNLKASLMTTDNYEDLICSKYLSEIRAVAINQDGKKFWKKHTNKIISLC